MLSGVTISMLHPQICSFLSMIAKLGKLHQVLAMVLFNLTLNCNAQLLTK